MLEEENAVFVLCFHTLEEKKPGFCLLIRLNWGRLCCVCTEVTKSKQLT